MIEMVYTCLKYLRDPNLTLNIHGSQSTFTFGHGWAPIENVAPWDEFSYSTMMSRFKSPLDKPLEISRFNQIYDEAGLNQVISLTIIMPVSKALPKSLFVTREGRGGVANIRPSWGSGSDKRKTSNGRYMPIVCGDTTKGWPVFEALKFIQNHPDGYDKVPTNYLARPFEQMQQYCLTFNTPYAFICTESCLVVLEFTLSSDAHRSPQPVRKPRTQSRILATSTKASTGPTSNFSGMSFEPFPVDRSVGLVKVWVIPWILEKVNYHQSSRYGASSCMVGITTGCSRAMIH
jgi:hypothetical protein